MKSLTIQQILFLHSRLIDETGGTTGLRDLGLLESALARPFSGIFGKEFYPTIFLKAAVLMESLTLNHAFLDGNKRFGISAAALFLMLNDKLLKVEQKEMETFALSVATKDKELSEIAVWFERYCVDLSN